MVHNKEGAPLGNTNAVKYGTPEERKALLELYVKHCEQGYPDDMFEECDIKTFKEYCKKYPVDFPTDQIHRAQMKRAKLVYDIGIRGTVGIPMTYINPKTKKQEQGKSFNAKSWQFIMMNLLNWRNRNDTTSKGDKMPNASFVMYRPEKLPDNYDEKMKAPGGSSAAHPANQQPVTAP